MTENDDELEKILDWYMEAFNFHREDKSMIAVKNVAYSVRELGAKDLKKSQARIQELETELKATIKARHEDQDKEVEKDGVISGLEDQVEKMQKEINFWKKSAKESAERAAFSRENEIDKVKKLHKAFDRNDELERALTFYHNIHGCTVKCGHKTCLVAKKALKKTEG